MNERSAFSDIDRELRNTSNIDGSYFITGPVTIHNVRLYNITIGPGSIIIGNSDVYDHTTTVCPLA
jgi:hypothetical protein